MNILKIFFLIVLWLISLTLGLSTVAGFIGGWDWRLDLFNHARPIYFCFLLIAFAVSVMIRNKALSLFNFSFLFTNFLLLSFLYFPPAKASKPSSSNSFTLMQFNVCAPSHGRNKLIHFLNAQNFDIVALEECDELCFNELKKGNVLSHYPVVVHQKTLKKRLVMLSRFPIQEETKFQFSGNPAILRLKIKLNNKWTHFLMMHSTRPSSGKTYHSQQIRQFKEIATLVQQTHSEPFIMVGDFNTTPWGYSFQKLIRETHLKNSMNGFGWQASFPVFVFYQYKREVVPLISIDHVLVSKDFIVVKRKTGPDLSSDHLPVIVELRTT